MCTDVFRANDTEPRQGFSESLVGKLVIHDGPKRDRDPYMGDLAVAALTSYLTHDVHEAARNVRPFTASLSFCHRILTGRNTARQSSLLDS